MKMIPKTARALVYGLAMGCCIIASAARAGTYYVATNGLDSNPGTRASPFATIQHAAEIVGAGDHVFIRGGTYYEDQIALAKSGTSNAPIKFSNFGNENPVVDFGLRVLYPWRACKRLAVPSACATPGYPHLYTVKPFYGRTIHHHWPSTTHSVIINGQIYSPAPCQSAQPASMCLPFMKPGNFFSDNASTAADFGYLYVYPLNSRGIPTAGAIVTIVNFNTNDPYTFPTGLYSYNPAHPNSVASNIVLEGLTLQGGEFGVMVRDPKANKDHRNFSILKSIIQYSYFQAVQFQNWESGTVGGTNILYNGLYNYPRGSVNPGWPVTVYGVNAEDIRLTGNSIHDNNGEGLGPGSGSVGWSIDHNILYGNYSVEIYLNTDGKSGLKNEYDGGHIVVDKNLIYETDEYADSNHAAKFDVRNYPIGIGVANEAASRTQGTGQAFDTITNNIIIGAGSAGIRVLNYGGSVFRLTDSLIANNTVIHMFNPPAGFGQTAYYGMQIEVSDNVRVDNNIIYPDSINLAGLADGKTGIIAHNNLVAGRSSIEAGRLVSLSGMVFGEPLFCQPGRTISASSYDLRPGSVALNTGEIVPAKAAGNVGTLAHDYFGNTRPANLPPDIGAYQHTSPAQAPAAAIRPRAAP